MINKKDMAIMYVFILLEILILINSKDIANNIVNTSKTFIIYIFPYLFPNILIGSILSNYDVYKIVPKFIRNHLKISNHIINIYILSLICGTPANACIIKRYLDNNIISEKEAESLLCITHFINPLFIIGSIGIGIFNDKKIGILLIFFSIISSIIKGIILRKNFTHKDTVINNTNTYTDIIKQSINAILNIFAIIIIFNVLIFLITNTFKVNQFINTIIKSLTEITSGIQSIRYLNTNILFKLLVAYYTISFGGICIHTQVFSIMNNKKIRYLKYLIFRVV